MNAMLSAFTGDASPAPMRFFSYKNPEQNTREQINKVRSHPYRKRCPCARLYFRRGDRSPAGSAANCAADCCLKESGLARFEFSLGQISVTLSSSAQT
jgi:hypothetical protein